MSQNQHLGIIQDAPQFEAFWSTDWMVLLSSFVEVKVTLKVNCASSWGKHQCNQPCMHEAWGAQYWWSWERVESSNIAFHYNSEVFCHSISCPQQWQFQGLLYVGFWYRSTPGVPHRVVPYCIGKNAGDTVTLQGSSNINIKRISV